MGQTWEPLHLVMDKYAAHKHPKIKAWLADNPRVRVHFRPPHASWTNLVEVWFSIIERPSHPPLLTVVCDDDVGVGVRR